MVRVRAIQYRKPDQSFSVILYSDKILNIKSAQFCRTESMNHFNIVKYFTTPVQTFWMLFFFDISSKTSNNNFEFNGPLNVRNFS